MKIIKTLLLLFVLISVSVSQSIDSDFYQKRYDHTRSGLGLHISGTTLRIFTFALFIQADSQSGSTTNDFGRGISGITGFTANSLRFVGNLTGGMAATRACNAYNQEYGTSEIFTWKYYKLGWGTYAAGLVISMLPPFQKLATPCFGIGIIVSEVCFYIHSIRARRITKRLLGTVSENNTISFGVSPIISQSGYGAALSVRF